MESVGRNGHNGSPSRGVSERIGIANSKAEYQMTKPTVLNELAYSLLSSYLKPEVAVEYERRRNCDTTVPDQVHKKFRTYKGDP